jgi:orotate phosphoribosyltransferase
MPSIAGTKLWDFCTERAYRILSNARPMPVGRAKQRNVEGAFACASVAGSRVVLLIDDIWATGASMSEAARALQPAVAYPLTMARTRHQGAP